MELKGTKTEKNLMEAFAGESQARNKYTFFASMAKKEGYEQLAAIFEETAGNEKEHAKIWFKLLCGGAIPDTLTCLDMAAGGEHDEWTEMYPRMASRTSFSVSRPLPRRRLKAAFSFSLSPSNAMGYSFSAETSAVILSASSVRRLSSYCR